MGHCNFRNHNNNNENAKRKDTEKLTPQSKTGGKKWKNTAKKYLEEKLVDIVKTNPHRNPKHNGRSARPRVQCNRIAITFKNWSQKRD